MNNVVLVMKESSFRSVVDELKEEIINNNLLISIMSDESFDLMFKREEKKMLTKYVRDERGKRVGVVVATGKTNVGWSLCHRTDRWDRAKALTIAEGRAINGSSKEIPHTVQYDFDCMVDRASRFYK